MPPNWMPNRQRQNKIKAKENRTNAVNELTSIVLVSNNKQLIELIFILPNIFKYLSVLHLY